MEHSFDIEVAKSCGVDAAVMVRHFQFWIIKNKSEGVNSRDGFTWSYCSLPGLQRVFPYWSVRQIRVILDRLIEVNILQKSCFAQAGKRKVNWYAFVDEARWIEPGLAAYSTKDDKNNPVNSDRINTGRRVKDDKNNPVNSDRKCNYGQEKSCQIGQDNPVNSDRKLKEYKEEDKELKDIIHTTGARAPAGGREKSSGIKGDKKSPPTFQQRFEQWFSEFWQLWPRKVGRGRAKKKLRALLREAGEPELIFDRIKNSIIAQTDAGMLRAKDRWTKHPATWLEGECWDDEIVWRGEDEDISGGNVGRGNMGRGNMGRGISAVEMVKRRMIEDKESNHDTA